MNLKYFGIVAQAILSSGKVQFDEIRLYFESVIVNKQLSVECLSVRVILCVVTSIVLCKAAECRSLLRRIRAVCKDELVSPIQRDAAIVVERCYCLKLNRIAVRTMCEDCLQLHQVFQELARIPIRKIQEERIFAAEEDLRFFLDSAYDRHIYTDTGNCRTAYICVSIPKDAKLDVIILSTFS